MIFRYVDGFRIQLQAERTAMNDYELEIHLGPRSDTAALLIEQVSDDHGPPPHTQIEL